MLDSLFGKLALVLFGLILMIGAALLGVVRFSSELYQQEVTQRLNADLAAQMVKDFKLITAETPNTAATEALFHDLMIINPSIEVYLLSPSGQLLSYSAPTERIHRRQVDLTPVRRFLEGNPSYPLLGDDPRLARGGKVFSTAEIRDHGQLQGYLYVILASEAYTSIANALRESYALRLGSWGLAVSLAIALTTGLLLFAWLTRRLSRLSSRVLALDPAPDDARHHGDELQRLEQRFDQMAAHIHRQLDALTEMDNQRREMVANVSHDLRTPLSTLHGYLETLLMKGERLSDKQRRQYLHTAVRNSEDLGRLVEQLFELARLDAGDALLRAESFALDELIQDTLLKYHLSAQEKDIELGVSAGRGLSLVQADIGLIQRALDNLIDNALRHTPDGGSIELTLAPGEGYVDVAIRDTGCGIPARDLTRVFERFYRRNKSREDGPAHAGLGLAIAKRIVELHGATIQASSTLGQGTTFSFALPCVSSESVAS